MVTTRTQRSNEQQRSTQLDSTEFDQGRKAHKRPASKETDPDFVSKQEDESMIASHRRVKRKAETVPDDGNSPMELQYLY